MAWDILKEVHDRLENDGKMDSGILNKTLRMVKATGNGHYEQGSAT